MSTSDMQSAHHNHSFGGELELSESSETLITEEASLEPRVFHLSSCNASENSEN